MGTMPEQFLRSRFDPQYVAVLAVCPQHIVFRDVAFLKFAVHLAPHVAVTISVCSGSGTTLYHPATTAFPGRSWMSYPANSRERFVHADASQ